MKKKRSLTTKTIATKGILTDPGRVGSFKTYQKFTTIGPPFFQDGRQDGRQYLLMIITM